jgi:hypothetical protein
VARCRHRPASEDDIATTRLSVLTRLLGVLVVAIALVAAVAVLSSSSSGPSGCVGSTRTTLGGGLLSAVTTVPGASFTTLPPSHDNDAGRSRIPDATPDADNDTSRARLVCAK